MVGAHLRAVATGKDDGARLKLTAHGRRIDQGKGRTVSVGGDEQGEMSCCSGQLPGTKGREF